MKYILILALFLTGCSGGSGGGSSPKKTGVAVFCDSTGQSKGDLVGWPDRLKTLISEPVWADCRSGWTLQDYDVKQAIEDSGIGYKYGVLVLGINDIGRGAYLGDVLDNYEISLNIIKSYGFEPVCHLYSYKTIASEIVNPFNDGVKFICNEKGYKVIQSTDQLFDGIHPSNQGSMETAENAWRVLY